MYRLETEAAFSKAVHENPVSALAEFDLTAEERTALLNGDVATLYLMGVHPFLLMTLSRQEMFGVNRENYLPRIRAAAAQAAQKRG
jgi:hypothetical protein